MRDRPILFSGPMVRAILEGRKTQTRRVLPDGNVYEDISSEALEDLELQGWEGFCRGEAMCAARYNFAPGARLWVREALQADRMVNILTGERTTNAIVAYYRADDTEALDPKGFNLSWAWKRGVIPSIHMPRSFSRLTLVVTAVRVERLQDISEEDARAEGCWPVWSGDMSEGPSRFADEEFRVLWSSINGPESWDANPWVAAITFEVMRANIDATPSPRPQHGGGAE